MSGEVFKGLDKLTSVFLYWNVCMGGNYEDPSRIAILQKTVNEKCSFDPQVMKISISKLETEQNNLKSKTLNLELQMKKIQSEKNLQLNKTEILLEVCNQNLLLSENTEKYQKIRLQNDELRQNFEYKMQENADLMKDLEKVRLEIIAFREQVALLEQKNSVLLGNQQKI